MTTCSRVSDCHCSHINIISLTRCAYSTKKAQGGKQHVLLPRWLRPIITCTMLTTDTRDLTLEKALALLADQGTQCCSTGLHFTIRVLLCFSVIYTEVCNPHLALLLHCFRPCTASLLMQRQACCQVAHDLSDIS